MSSETALAVLESPKEAPSAIMKTATDVASVTREIVLRTVMELSGRRYVKVEGWMSIAAAYGCVPSIREVTEDERGVRAVAELRRHDGTVLASAEGYVGLDEPRWATQPTYARRGMAQTRAVSRVCRSVFAFVVVLIDANLSTTPAEEIPSGDVVATAIVRQAGTMPARNDDAGMERTKRTEVRYGPFKGKHLCDIPDTNLQWIRPLARAAVEKNDPKWHVSNVAYHQAVEEEHARRGGK